MTEQLFTAFPPVSAEQWIQQVIKDLKGESFEEKLTYQSPEGIAIKPFYTAEDLDKYSTRKPLFTHADWEICESVTVTDVKAANQKALDTLNNGATSLLLYVNHDADLHTLLQEIGIEYISIQFVVKGDAETFYKNLTAYIQSKDLTGTPDITINVDPVENLVRTGNWRHSQQQDTVELLGISAGPYRTICINAGIYHNAGAPAAYEIGCALAHANTYINWFLEHSTDVQNLAGKFQLNIAVGPDYFFEIAKLRAVRKTFALLFEEYGIKSDIYIHAETAFRNVTVFDAHNNLLRTTTEAMAATIGGCNSLYIQPFDFAYEQENTFSDRLARNIQLILKSESYFDKVTDVSAGSFFIEELTEQIAAKAWEYFTGIEKSGGFIAALEQGIVQQTIHTFSVAQQERFNTGKEVLVGTNKFPDPKENKQNIAGKIVWGNEKETGKIIAPLNTVRLSASNEKERLK